MKEEVCLFECPFKYQQCFAEIAYCTFKIKSTLFDTVLPGNRLQTAFYAVFTEFLFMSPVIPSHLLIFNLLLLQKAL